MTSDSELLTCFVRTRSEVAFAELVGRYVHLVYSAALRQVGGDATLAQDVAQSVFSDLARKASALAARETLTGWLYTSGRFAAAKIMRAENRRRDREERFMRESKEAGPETDWEQLRPVLDEVMHQLPKTLLGRWTSDSLEYYEHDQIKTRTRHRRAWRIDCPRP